MKGFRWSGTKSASLILLVLFVLGGTIRFGRSSREMGAASLDARVPVSERRHRTPIYFEADKGRDGVRAQFTARGSGYVAAVGPAEMRFRFKTPPVARSSDTALGIAVDKSGSVYVTGLATTLDFPTTPGAFQTDSGSTNRMFLAKLSSDGSTVDYSAAFGGTSSIQMGNAIAVDDTGVAYVTGWTDAMDWPVTANAYQPTNGCGCTTPLTAEGATDAFLAKLSADGSALLYSTYFGGSDEDPAFGIALDSGKNIYITGYTRSPDLPIKNPLPGQNKKKVGGTPTAFVTKFNADGSLGYSTYLGGGLARDDDRAFAIAVDASGSAYVTGATVSSDFPITSAAFQTAIGRQDNAPNGAYTNAFVAKLGRCPLRCWK